MFCGACGAKNPDTNRFCTSCGRPLETVPPGPGPAASPQHEEILMIVPFAEQGTIFTDAFTLVITPRRLIFARVPEEMAPAFAGAEEAIDDEWVEIEDQAAQRSHLNSRAWGPGPWQRYGTMDAESIARSSPKNAVFPLAGISELTLIIDNEIDLDDTLFIGTDEGEIEFTLKFAAGDRVAPLLSSLMGTRFIQHTRTEWEAMHRRRRF